MASNQKIRIKIKGYEHATVDAAAAKIAEAAKRSGSQVSGPIPLPTDKEIVTILRATHKYKDSREQFERRTHKRLIDVIRRLRRPRKLCRSWRFRQALTLLSWNSSKKARAAKAILPQMVETPSVMLTKVNQ